jgi:hypothetical protein
MRLFGAAMVRNEADVIEAFVRHNLTAVDGLAILEHGSTDGTAAILQSLVREGLPVFLSTEDRPQFSQWQQMTWLVRDIMARERPDFVFALDADEFLNVKSRALLETALSAIPDGMHGVIEWRTYVPVFSESLGILAALRSSRRVTSLPVTEHKAVVSTRAFLADNSAVLSNGNHYVARTNTLGGPTATRAAKLRADVVTLAHVPIRSVSQYTSKFAVNWLSMLATGPVPEKQAVHWREAFARLRRGERPAESELELTAANYGLPREQWLPHQAITYVEEPFLADFALRYEQMGIRDPLALVLAQAERLIASSH